MADWMVFLEDLAIECELSPEQKRVFLARFDRTNAGKTNKWIVDRTKDDDNQQVFAGDAAFTKSMTAVYRAFQQTLFPDLSEVSKGKKEKLEAFLKSEFERRQKAEVPVAESTTEPRSGLNPGAPMPKVRLPEIFVARPRTLVAVKRKLLVESEQMLVVNAILGMGGLGKSVLATAIVLDPEVQARFEDGILWKTLGQSPDLLSCLGDWIRELDKSRETYSANTVEAASRYLGMLLVERRMLLVVDDVWNGAHAEWFRVGGPDCRILVTTREKWRLDGVAYHELDLMSKEESLELVRRKLNNKWKPEMEVEAAAFARLVGYLPLALDLAANLVSEGLSWEELRSEFEVERRAVTLDILDSSESFEQLSEEEREKEERKHSLQACFNLSLKRLKPEQLQQFIWLGVLPEDVNLTARVAAVLWDLTEIKAKKALIDLRNRSFLTDGVMTVEEERTYRVHDLMHDMARGLIEKETLELPSLNSAFSTLNSAHGEFLERYRKCCSNGRWDGLPNDGYIHQYLTWHMERAGWVDEIHSLMAMSDEQGRNAWFEVCEQLGQPAFFVQDVARGWRLAEEIYEREPDKSIILQVRYALTQATLKSALNNISPQLLSALVKHDLWSEERAWEFIESRDNIFIQAYALEALIPYLSKPLLKKALKMIENFADKEMQAKCFVSLSEIQPEFIQKAYDVIQEIQGFQDFEKRAILLSELSKKYPPYFDEAIEQANKIPNSFQQAVAFIEMLPRKINLLEKILKLAEGLTQDDYHSLTLAEQQLRRDEQAILYSKIISHRPDLLDTTLISARQTKYYNTKTCILTNLVRHDETLLNETLTSIENIQGGYLKSINLVKLAEYDLKFLPEALATGQMIEDKFEQALLLAELIEYNFNFLDDAISNARQVQDAYEQAFALSKIVPRSSEIFDETLTVARKVEDEHLQASVLVDLSELTKSDTQRIELLEESVDVADSSQWEHRKGWILRDLSKQELSKDLFDRIKQSTKTIKDPVEKAKTLTALSKHDSLIVNEVLDLIDLIENQRKLIKETNELYSLMIQYEHFIILSILAKEKSEFFPKAKELAYKIEDLTYHALALCELSKIQSSHFEQALDAIIHLPASWAQANAFISLYWHAPNLLFPKVWNAIESIISTDDRARAYSSTILELLSPEDYSFSMWKHILHLLSHRRRAELIKDLIKLIPAIQFLGGKNSPNGIAKAMQEVCEQWK
jgi:hypothetical protein